MPLYADTPVRRARQVAGDLVVVSVLVVTVAVALQVRSWVLELGAVGRQMSDAGAGLSGAFDGAARSADRVPVVGQPLAEGLGRGTGAGQALTAAGQAQVSAVEALGTWLAVLIIAGPALLALVGWLPWRVLYLRRSGAVQRMARSGNEDLLALRALTRLPLGRLVAIAPDPAGAWRRGDATVVTALAAAEMRAVGLTPRPVARSGPRELTG